MYHQQLVYHLFGREELMVCSWERIPNTQSYKYVVRNIQQSQQYRCIAGNNAGTLVSNAATIDSEMLSKYI